jgi:hypothetical protein
MKKQNVRQWLGGLSLLLLILGACSGAEAPNAANVEVSSATAAATPARRPAPTVPPLDPTYAAQIAAMRSPEVPDLPFADNPDPAQCGIPVNWGSEEPAYLTGMYDGDLVQPTVLLYDSHLRFNIEASAPHGSEVQILLYQQNPVIDYYLVKVVGAPLPNEGWVPAPFLSFEPVS